MSVCVEFVHVFSAGRVQTTLLGHNFELANRGTVSIINAISEEVTEAG